MVAIGRTRSRLRPCVVLFPVKSGGLPTAGFNREASVWFATSTTRLDTHVPTLSCAPWMAKAAQKWGWLQFADAVSGSQAVGGVCLAAEAGRLSADIFEPVSGPCRHRPRFLADPPNIRRQNGVAAAACAYGLKGQFRWLGCTGITPDSPLAHMW
jgi:hypothetical protein